MTPLQNLRALKLKQFEDLKKDHFSNLPNPYFAEKKIITKAFDDGFELAGTFVFSQSEEYYNNISK